MVSSLHGLVVSYRARWVIQIPARQASIALAIVERSDDQLCLEVRVVTISRYETFRRDAGIQRARHAPRGGPEGSCGGHGHRTDLRGRRLAGRLAGDSGRT